MSTTQERTKQVWIRVTPGEHERLTRLAARDSKRLGVKVTVAGLCRKQLLRLLERRNA